MNTPMTPEALKRAFEEELMNIAPDASLDGVAEDADLRDALDLDSMDIMNLVIALHDRLGIDIPDKDAAQLVTIKGAVDYLSSKR